MSKFRTKKQKNKIEVCGKTPVGLLGASLVDFANSLPYQVRNELTPAMPEFAKFFEYCAGFYHTKTTGNNYNRVYFMALTKSNDMEISLVESDVKYGFVLSVGLLRGLLKEALPIMLKERYSNYHRGDSRKKETKSMDWVKPDFKAFRYLHSLLDVINFVKESPCDVVECSATVDVWYFQTRHGYGYSHYSYRNKRMPKIRHISKRYENTNWYNTARKCYYDNYQESAWSTHEPREIIQEGMDYDVILSELIMTYN